MFAEEYLSSELSTDSCLQISKCHLLVGRRTIYACMLYIEEIFNLVFEIMPVNSRMEANTSLTLTSICDF